MPPYCSFPGCPDLAVSKGFCMGHYLQRRAGKPLTPKRPRRKKSMTRAAEPCLVKWCETPAASRGLCNSHAGVSWRFNIEPRALAELLEHPCAICGSIENRRIDHDHTCCGSVNGSCGKCIRGVLCNSCNVRIGRLASVTSRDLEYIQSGIRLKVAPAASSMVNKKRNQNTKRGADIDIDRSMH